MITRIINISRYILLNSISLLSRISSDTIITSSELDLINSSIASIITRLLSTSNSSTILISNWLLISSVDSNLVLYLGNSSTSSRTIRIN